METSLRWSNELSNEQEHCPPEHQNTFRVTAYLFARKTTTAG